MKARLNDRQIDELLAGHQPAGIESDGLSELVVAAGHLLQERPDESTTRKHLAEMFEALVPASSGQEPWAAASVTNRRSMLSRTKAFALRVVAAVVVLMGGSVSLAYAGVDLPGTAAERAMEKVFGVELPNQEHKGDDDKDSKKAKADEVSEYEGSAKKSKKDKDEAGGKSVSAAVHEVIEGSDERGCEFGQAVAAAARANSQSDNAGAEDPCTNGPSGDDHGNSDDSHGRSDEDHGKAANSSGKSDEDHASATKNEDTVETKDDKAEAKAEAKADDERGKSDEEHGKSADGNGNGKSDEAPGHADETDDDE